MAHACKVGHARTNTCKCTVLNNLRMDTTSHMAKTGLVTRMEILWRNTAMGPCEPCLKGNQSCHRIHKVMAIHTDCALSHVFSDTHGLLATQSQNGHKPLVTLIDNHARDASIYGQHDESQVGQAFKAFVSWAQTSTRQKVKALHCNGSGKHKAGHLQEALRHAVPLHDALPTHALGFFTPEEVFSSNKPDVFQLQA